MVKESRVFVEKLEEVTKKIYETFKKPKLIIFDEAAKRLHESQNKCYACGEKFKDDDINMRKVRDHCHYTGKYRGALHNKCNLRLKRTRTITVFFHNLTGYDCHLFVKRLADSQGDVSCITRNEEKYVAFNKRVLVDTIVTDDEKEVNVYSCLRFVDTMNFMRISLEKLVGNLDKPSFEHTGKYFRGEELDLMLRKGVYPYEYMTGVQRLREQSLPPKEEFAFLLGTGVPGSPTRTPSHPRIYPRRIINTHRRFSKPSAVRTWPTTQCCIASRTSTFYGHGLPLLPDPDGGLLRGYIEGRSQMVRHQQLPEGTPHRRREQKGTGDDEG